MDKETLLQYQKNRKEILQLREEIDALWGRLLAPGTTKYSGMPTAHGGNSDPTGDGVAAADALLFKYQKKHQELCAMQLAIETAIDSLDPVSRTLLRARYIKGSQWENICFELGYSWRQTHRLHRRALEKLAAI